MLSSIFAGLAVLSALLLLWQWVVAIRFPLHQRISDKSFQPALTILKPLKGCDEFTGACLQSWLEQDYRGDTQILFGVASTSDPVCDLVNALLANYSDRDARLVICGPPAGANAKVSKLAHLTDLAKHEILVISDADVKVPRDFLSNGVAGLRNEAIGLVNCFYRLANPSSTATQWEAVAINADFWSQVLQARSLKPLDFALGAVMITRRKQLGEIGGFASLIHCLADDYQLGHRIAKKGYALDLCPVVAECWSAPMNWREVWKHQLRWARTIRVCQPLPYFFSILSNATLWPLIWLLVRPGPISLGVFASVLFARLIVTENLVRNMCGRNRRRESAPTIVENDLDQQPATEGEMSADSRRSLRTRSWMAPIKDLLQAAIWLASFLGNEIEWRGERMKLRRDGTLIKTRRTNDEVRMKQ